MADVNPIPEGYPRVTPYLHVDGAADAIDFYVKVLGAKERMRMPGPEGKLGHAELELGGSAIMLADEFPESDVRSPKSVGGTPVMLYVYVEDVDSVFDAAMEAGAKELRPVENQSYGDRDASLKDPFGNEWYIGTRLEGGYIPQGLHTVTTYLHPKGAPQMIDFLKRAFGAEEIARYASPDGVVHHAQVKIGDSIIEMGEAHAEFQPMPTAFYLYVEDADAWYRRAMQAGATSIYEPADQPYGDRNGGVRDPFGNQWFIGTHIRDVE